MTKERPLCPYCYRGSCPWLTAYISERVHRVSMFPEEGTPPADVCPLYDEPLAPNIRRQLTADLVRAST